MPRIFVRSGHQSVSYNQNCYVVCNLIGNNTELTHLLNVDVKDKNTFYDTEALK